MIYTSTEKAAITRRFIGSLVVMSKEQIYLLRYIIKHGSISTDNCTNSEKEALSWLLKMGYIFAVTDGTDYQNFTSTRKVTQQGLAAYASHRKSIRTDVLSIVAVAISATTLVLSILGII